MARRSISIEEKIAAQREVVEKAKAKYEEAQAELDVLLKKKEELKNKELMDAMMSSKKSFEEIMAFLKDGEEQEAEA